MFTSEIIMTLARKKYDEEFPVTFKSSKRLWMIFDNLYIGWIIPVLVFASAAALIESLHATFLRISQLFLVSRSFSIYEIATLLQEQKHWILLVIMVGTLFIIPIIRLCVLLLSWIIPMSIRNQIVAKHIIDVFSRWCMLDVFGLALLLIATEGKDLVKTEIQSGIKVVVVAIGLSYLLGLIAIVLNKAIISRSVVPSKSSDKQ
jgi:uncharacterized paraquat-inducible protein A